MTKSPKDCNCKEGFGKSVLHSLQDGLEKITIDTYRVRKSTENDVAGVWEGKKKAVWERKGWTSRFLWDAHSFRKKKKVAQEASTDPQVQS